MRQSSSGMQFVDPKDSESWIEIPQERVFRVSESKTPEANEILQARPFEILPDDLAGEWIDFPPPPAASAGAHPYLLRGLAYPNIGGGPAVWLMVWEQQDTKEVWVQQCTCRFEMLFPGMHWNLIESPVIAWLQEPPTRASCTAHLGGDMLAARPSKRLAFVLGKKF